MRLHLKWTTASYCPLPTNNVFIGTLPSLKWGFMHVYCLPRKAELFPSLLNTHLSVQKNNQLHWKEPRPVLFSSTAALTQLSKSLLYNRHVFRACWAALIGGKSVTLFPRQAAWHVLRHLSVSSIVTTRLDYMTMHCSSLIAWASGSIGLVVKKSESARIFNQSEHVSPFSPVYIMALIACKPGGFKFIL